MSPTLQFVHRFGRNRPAVAGVVVLALAAFAAAFGPTLYNVDPFEMLGRPSQPPSARFPLGTDVSGRDILAGLLYGARVSLFVGIVASLLATSVGVLVGALAGFFGGVVDDILMRIVDFFLTIPSFVLAVVLVAILNPTITIITLTIAIVSWPSVARLVRGEFVSQRSRDYVMASKGLGMSTAEIIVVQILPNTLAPIVVVASLMVATAILTEAGLSFLGLSDPDVISWGYMIGVGRAVLRSAWWMAAIPGITIMITVLAINLIGEGLNDALNPRLRQR
ncbi:MAG: ABC transporter permease [Acuticoccus sp.]